jgi:hypothetical protein
MLAFDKLGMTTTTARRSKAAEKKSRQAIYIM